MSEDKNEDCVFDVDKINEQLNKLNSIYNEGVDHCIEVVKKYYLDRPHIQNYSAGFFNDVVEQLEQLKKPLQ